MNQTQEFYANLFRAEHQGGIKKMRDQLYEQEKKEEQRERVENHLREHLTVIVDELKAVPPAIAWELIERIAAEEGKRV